MVYRWSTIIAYCLLLFIIGGLEVACLPLVPKLAGSHPAKAVGFFGTKISSARLPSEGTYSRWSHVVALRHVKDP